MTTKLYKWDKYDALARLGEVGLVMCPATMGLVLKMLASVKDGGFTYTPTDEELEQAVFIDAILYVFRELIKQGVIDINTLGDSNESGGNK